MNDREKLIAELEEIADILRRANHDEQRAAAAEQAIAALKDDGWQPIETAPRDGTRILVYVGNGKMAVARWEQYGLRSYWLIYSLADSWIKRLCGMGEASALDKHCPPIKWQPLPAPPKKEQNDDE